MAESVVRQSGMLSISLMKPTSLAAAQAELTGDFRILSLVIQHSNTGEHAYGLPARLPCVPQVPLIQPETSKSPYLLQMTSISQCRQGRLPATRCVMHS